MTDRYANYTYENILAAALARVPNTLDKRPGSIIYDALAPACYLMAEVFMQMAELFDATFADTSTGEYLSLRTSEMGVTRQPATKATRKGEFNLVVAVGTRFGINDATFIVTQNLTGFDSELECEQAGVIGNAYTGALIPIDYISGLTTANLTDVIIPGEDEESDDALRLRYFENLASQAFGGNIADYKTKTKALAGVGGCKVYPVWNGGGTVKLVITDSTGLVPSPAVVSSVQEAIDPVAMAGNGLGIAPIGHVVTVAAATGITVNVGVSVTLEIGYIWVDVEPYVEAAIETYLATLRSTWDQETVTTVRISQIESAILQVTGILDITGTTLNTVASNLVLNSPEIPLLGAVTNS